MSQSELPLDITEAKQNKPPQPSDRNQVRLHQPVRNQVEMIMRDLDSLIAPDHPVRSIWAFLQRLDLDAFYSTSGQS